MTNEPKAYSYLRFSTPEQMRGDSFRRQTEAAQTYADRHGLDLDDELTFRDLGVSAFRGTNVIEGALGQFIEAVDSGRVRPGSYLLVENLDRLSRDKIMPALNRFHSLLEKGINIITLSDGRMYDAESLNDLTGLLVPLVNMARANEESELKSRRLKAVWKNKKDRAAKGEHILTANAPAWLQLRNGKFEVLEDRAAIVRRIFKMALEGHGKDGIASRLNEEGVKPLGKSKGWYPSYVQRILANEAVIGRFQPGHHVWVDGKVRREPDGDPIEGYYPAILDPEDFYRVRQAKPGASGRKGKALTNILRGLAFCSKCGGAMHYVSKGRPYLACDNARRKHKCDAKSVRYDMVTNAILGGLEAGELDVRNLLSNGQVDRRQEIHHRVEAIDGQIDEFETRISNLLDVLSRQPSPAIETRLAEYESNVAQHHQDKADLEAEMHSLANGQDHLGNTLHAMSEVRRALANGDVVEVGEVRVRFNAALKRLIASIEIGVVGDMNRESNKPIWANFTKFQDHVEMPLIPITVTFHQEGRYLLIYADPKKSLGFVAGAIKADEPGKFRLSGHWSTLIKPGVLEAIF
jgi:DNA invertase Pin-like site-specific DNA recombinase